jgi:hypothetical protein
MWRLLLIVVVVLAVAVPGCKKQGVKTSAPAGPAGQQPVAATQPGEQVGVHAPTAVVVQPALGGGGSGGAVQAVRQAVIRTVNQADLDQIRLFIYNASLANDQMPSAQEINAVLQKEAPKTWKQVQDGAIVITGTRSREGIWAYTADAQTVGGEHLVVTSSGIERMPAATLRGRLQ